MGPEEWTELWRIGKIGFHQPAVHSVLLQYGKELAHEPGRIFVPLCGKSLDLLWLRSQGHTVVGVELSDVALQAFCMENGVPARRRSLTEFDAYEAHHLTLYRGDLFALTPTMLGRIDAVYDRASLIAFPSELRQRYVDQLTALTAIGTSTLLITLEYPQAQLSGPPFSVDAREVAHLYSTTHEVQELSRRDILASEPRLRARGVSTLSEVCYRLIRRSSR